MLLCDNGGVGSGESWSRNRQPSMFDFSHVDSVGE